MLKFRSIAALAIGAVLVDSPITSAQLINRTKNRNVKLSSHESESGRATVQTNSPEAGGSNDSVETPGTKGHRHPDWPRIKPLPLIAAPPSAAKTAPQTPAVSKHPKIGNWVASIPLVTVETSGPAEINLGRRATFTITVRNDGEIATQELILHAVLPAGAELVEAEPKPEMSERRLEYVLKELAPKAAHKLRLDLIPRQRGSLELNTHVYAKTQSTTAIQVRRPDVAVTFDGPSQAVLGDTVRFKVKITNTGDGLVEDVSIAQTVVDAEKPAEVTQTQALFAEMPQRISRLQPGDSQEFELDAHITRAGSMRAEILVKAADGLEARATAEVQVRQPVIELKTIGPDSRQVQRAAGYVIVVSNTGDVAAENVAVTATVPSGLEVVGIEKRTTFDKDSNTLTWNLPKVEAGSTEALKFQAKGVQDGVQTIQIAATACRLPAVEASHVTRVTGMADLVLVIEDVPGPIEVGDEATYELRVKNCGSKAAQKVLVRCTLPSGLKVEESSEFTLSGSTLEFKLIENLPEGDEKVLQFKATGCEAGDQAIRISLSGDTVGREIVVETSTLFFKSEK